MASQYMMKLKRWDLNRAARIGGNGLVLGLWLWLYRPVFQYLGIIFSRNDFRTNQVMLVGVVVLIVWQLRCQGVGVAFDAAPRLFVPGLALAFREHMETFVGCPVRLLTARIVRDGLAAAGASSVGIDTILVLENRVSHIDLPCSGVKSLWSGALFFVAATWVDRRRLNLRWLLMALVLAGMLFAANLARVAILVIAGQVMGWEVLAELVHVPLGVLGFAAVCGIAVGLLSFQPEIAQGSDGGGRPGGARPVWQTPGLAVAILAMGLVYAPRPETGLAQEPPTWELPSHLVTEPDQSCEYWTDGL